MPARIRARHAPRGQAIATGQPQPWACLACPRQLGTLLGGTLTLDLRQVQGVALDHEGAAAIRCWCGRVAFWWPTRRTV